jgi:hypothetical protein
MAVQEQEQLATDETLIEGRDDLEAALEDREKRKNSKNELNRQFKEADERVRALLSEFDLADGEVARCGRFRISRTLSPGRSVAFETEPKSRVSIKADKDEA